MISFADFNVSIKSAGSLKISIKREWAVEIRDKAFKKPNSLLEMKKIRCYDQYICYGSILSLV